MKDLERDLLIGGPVVRDPDGAEAAFPESCHELISTDLVAST